MSAENIAAAHQKRRKALAKRAADEIARLWARIDRTDIARSWAASIPAAFTVLASAQAIAAAMAPVYLDDLAEAYSAPDDPAARVRVDGFAGVASDGRDLPALLFEPAIASLAALKQGATLPRALASGGFALDMITRTQVADAGRTADQVAMVAHTRMRGYVRVLSPPSCSRCVVLAGKFYRWNAGFQRHPRCFPPGVVVDGPRALAATRRIYQGELVVLATASGQKLSLTGNHPVLTRRGWVPAHLLQEGDEVVRRTRAEGATPLVVPDHHQVPARIEDVWGSLGVPLLDAVESSPEDFHGDGQHGKVDVVWADGPLDDRILAALPEHASQLQFPRTARAALALDGERPAELLDLSNPSHTCGAVGVDDLGAALLGRLLRSADEPGLAHTAALHSSFGEDAGDGAARDAVLLGQSEFAGPGQVGGHDGLSGQLQDLARWDAPDGAFSIETRDGYAARGLDLLQRLSGQVELDRLVEVRRVDWSGHVYSLTSSEGWHSANSLIVSNCDCTHQPVVSASAADGRLTRPKAYFDSLDPAEQDRVFTKAGAEAIRLGADPSQVVNARRGAAGLTPAGARITAEEARAIRGGREHGRLEPTNVFGQQVFITTEGTTTRGLAGQRLGARESGQQLAGNRYRTARPPRLMPESILSAANGNRDEAIRLLKRFGYIV